ncbi:NUDIX hydrolase (fragment) [Candidatus Zixiibacteriota bacterium]
MNDRKFDDKLLMARKHDFSGYKFCPLCGSGLERKVLDNRPRMKCGSPSCDFVYYHNPTPAAGAIVIDQGRLLMVKRAAPPKVDWWCFPAGFMEWDEHPSQTAIREIKEETGLDIRLESLFEIYSGNDDPRTNALLILYIATAVGGVLQPGDDASEAEFFPFEQVPERIAFLSHRQALADYEKRFLKAIK